METKEKEKTETTTPSSTATITLKRIAQVIAKVRIEGVTPLIQSKWRQKSIQQIKEKQSATKGKTRVLEARDPEQEMKEATYRLEDGRAGMPAAAFKGAIVSAARLFDGVTLTELKQAVFVIGEGPDQLVPLISEEPIMFENAVRIGQGTSDLRYRPMFETWAADLYIQHLPSQIDFESLMILVDAAGIGGVGEWRPTSPKNHTGSYGRFCVSETQEAA